MLKKNIDNISTPLITVLMPVYNAEKYLKEAIDSILQQTFVDFEFLIINDGSTDSSKEIILSYSDPRIIYIENQTNKKLVETLNIGLNLARGKYIARMDADDIAFPERLKLQYKFMENNPKVAASGTAFEVFGNNSEIFRYEINHNKIRFNMLYYTQICHPSAIIRKEILDKFNIRYNTKYFNAEDLDLFVTIGEVAELANITDVLFKYREHSENVTHLYKQIRNEDTKKVIKSEFEKIGITPNNDEMELYSRFAYTCFDFNKNDFVKLELFLINLINANNQSKYFSVNEFQEYIGEKWFHLYYNIKGNYLKWSFFKYFKSPLCKFYKQGFIVKLKFLIKSFLNML